ncbi:MAG: Hpt domain-containing protein [Thermodesulfobacteriota bacterium]
MYMDSQSATINERPDVILDLNRLKMNCNGRSEVVNELLNHLQERSGPKWMAALNEGLQAADSEMLREISHGMKGASATVFAWRISNLALEFEQLARDGKVDVLKGRMGELKQAFDELKQWISLNT